MLDVVLVRVWRVPSAHFVHTWASLLERPYIEILSFFFYHEPRMKYSKNPKRCVGRVGCKRPGCEA